MVGPIPATTIPVNTLNKSVIDNNPLMQQMLQMQHMQMMQNQLYLRNLRKQAIHKLSQSEQWSSLTTVEQNLLISQFLASNQQHSEFADISVPSASFVTPSIPTPSTNPVIQLINQMQQVLFIIQNIICLFTSTIYSGNPLIILS